MALLAKAGCFSDVRRRRVVQPPDPARGPEGTEPPGDVPRHRPALPRARNQFALLQHHRFPAGHGRESIQRHLEMLRELGPTWASFYILCPIPGTEQYDDFLAQGLITEKNLDRFDTTCLTWRHPSLSRQELSRFALPMLSQVLLGTACIIKRRR